MRVHIGHSTITGGTCGRGAFHGERDICVSQRTFFREIEKRHRCRYCVRSQYPNGGDPDAAPGSLDKVD
jgi:hypothetical protein